MTRKVLLVFGIVSSLLYVVMNILGAVRFDGYSSISQTVSELSAIGAPSRSLWVGLAIVYGALLIAFGLGVCLSAHGKRVLRVAGGLLVADGVIGFAWPPMHLRGEMTSLTDTLHIVFTLVIVPLMLVVIVVAAAAFGKQFRLYSSATILIMLVFGILTGLDAPRIAKNLPTPLIGVWERINIGAFLLWVIVLAIALLRVQTKRPKIDLVGEEVNIEANSVRLRSQSFRAG